MSSESAPRCFETHRRLEWQLTKSSGDSLLELILEFIYKKVKYPPNRPFGDEVNKILLNSHCTKDAALLQLKKTYPGTVEKVPPLRLTLSLPREWYCICRAPPSLPPIQRELNTAKIRWNNLNPAVLLMSPVETELSSLDGYLKCNLFHDYF